jgi:hypothetical protein
LRRRFRNYLTREVRNPKRYRMGDFLNRYSGYVWFYFFRLQAGLDIVEDQLMKAYTPPLNMTYKGEIGKMVRAFA